MVMNEDGITEYLGNFDDYLEKRDRPTPPPENAPEGATKTALVRERKRDRQQSARLRELKAAVTRAEEAITRNEARIRELETQLADPATYADSALMLSLTQAYQQEQAQQETLYDALESAETVWREAEAETEG
jgi:ATP-binding cassette subfamily F protein 3